MDAPTSFDRELGPGGLEGRVVPVADGAVVARAADDDSGPVIEGYGSVSEVVATIEGFFGEWDEIVAAGAWEKTIAEGDIRSMFNHDPAWLLGRTKTGTLRLAEDNIGLRYAVDINPDDVNAMSVYAKVARTDVDGSSVWFRVVRQEWTYPDETNNLERPLRRIQEGALIETGPVVMPAFLQTTAQARALRPLDAVLRAAGIASAGRRARLAFDLIASPDALEDELRHLFASAPALRDAVCACETSARAADVTPAPVVVSAPGGSAAVWQAISRCIGQPAA